MKITLIMSSLAAAMLIVGCTDVATPEAKAAADQPVAETATQQYNEKKPFVSEESLGLRKTDLYSESTTVASKTTYRTDYAGGSQTIERAFDNAPPMIPHDVEGMLPITISNNACTGCHMPEVASSMGATAIPESHFASFRPVTQIAADGKIIKDGQVVENTSDKLTSLHKLDDLSKARFNCSQCHAPQSTGDLLVENNFRPDFQSEEMKKKSSLLDTLNVGVE